MVLYYVRSILCTAPVVNYQVPNLLNNLVETMHLIYFHASSCGFGGGCRTVDLRAVNIYDKYRLYKCIRFRQRNV